MRNHGILVKSPLLMSTTRLGASLLDQYVIEVDHDMTLRSVYEVLLLLLVLVLHGHGRVIVTLYLLLMMSNRPLLAHGLAEELLESLRVGKDV